MVTRRLLLMAGAAYAAGATAAQKKSDGKKPAQRRKEDKSVLPTDQMAPELAPLEVQTLPEYVIGYPVHVAVTVRHGPAGEGEPYLSLPFADEFSTQGAFGLSLVARGREVFVCHPLPVFDPDLGQSSYDLRPGESRRILIDLSLLLPPSLQPDSYHAVLTYGPKQMRTASGGFALNLRAPNPTESAALAEVASELKLARGWGLWSKLPPKQPYRDAASSRQDPARYNRVLRYLFFSPEVTPGVLDALDGIYEVDAGVLRAELAMLAEDTALFEAYSRRMLSSFPGVRWQIERIMNQASPVIWRRKTLAGER